MDVGNGALQFIQSVNLDRLNRDRHVADNSNARGEIGIFESRNDFFAKVLTPADEQRIKSHILSPNHIEQSVDRVSYLLVFVVLRGMKEAVLTLAALVNYADNHIVFFVFKCLRSMDIAEDFDPVAVDNSEDDLGLGLNHLFYRRCVNEVLASVSERLNQLNSRQLNNKHLIVAAEHADYQTQAISLLDLAHTNRTQECSELRGYSNDTLSVNTGLYVLGVDVLSLRELDCLVYVVGLWRDRDQNRAGPLLLLAHNEVQLHLHLQLQ